MLPIDRRSFLAAGAAVLASPLLARAAEDAPKFKLGIVTYNVPATWDLPTILKTCQKVGIAAVECRTTHKHGVEPTLTADERKTVKKRFADAGIIFWGCGSVCEFHSADEAVVKKNIEDCKKFIDLVKELGGIGVKVRPNGVAKGHTVEQANTQIGTALKECGKAAGDAGIEICVEVHGAVSAIPKNMRAIMDACGHKSVGVTWNSNATDLIDGKLDEGFDLLKRYIRSCHINDLTNDKAGKYPYRDLFKKLRGIGYDRYTMCEVGKTYEPEAGLKFLMEYKELWDNLAKGKA
jgi:sugar phosphate isomerase/epimerase